MSRLVTMACLLLLLASEALAGPPLELVAERPGAIELRWAGGAPGPTAYAVWRREGLRGGWERIGAAPGEATSYVDRAVQPRRFYSYRLAPEGGEPSEAGPAEALAPFYLELLEAPLDAAVLKVHEWDETFDEWRASDPVRVPAGQKVFAAGVVSEFAPGATIVAAGPDPAQPGVGRALFRTREGALVEVTTADPLPLALRQQKPKPRRAARKAEPAPAREQPPEPEPIPVVPEGPTLQFPEPLQIGTVPGGRVVWEIQNDSKHRLLIVVTGRVSRTFPVGPGQTYEVKFPGGGDFTVVANASDNMIIPLKGQFGLRDGIRYRSVLGIRPAGR